METHFPHKPMAQATKSTSTLCKCGNEATVTFIEQRICRDCYDKCRGASPALVIKDLLGLDKFTGMTFRQFDQEMIFNAIKDKLGISVDAVTVNERNRMVAIRIDKHDVKAVLMLVERCSATFQLNYDGTIYLLSIFL